MAVMLHACRHGHINEPSSYSKKVNTSGRDGVRNNHTSLAPPSVESIISFRISQTLALPETSSRGRAARMNTAQEGITPFKARIPFFLFS